MNTFPCQNETHTIIGCAFEVLNGVGHGLSEKVYENSLVVEFVRKKIRYEQQRRFEVIYNGVQVGQLFLT